MAVESFGCRFAFLSWSGTSAAAGFEAQGPSNSHTPFTAILPNSCMILGDLAEARGCLGHLD